MKYFILSIAALLFFVFDSIFAELFSGKFFGVEFFLVPHFLMIFIFFLTIFGTRKVGMIVAAVLGLAYDVVYTEILGINLLFLPFLAYIIAKCMKVLQSNLIIVTFISFLFVGIYEIVIYEMYYIMSFADVSFIEFTKLRLLPTMLLNLIFTILCCYPLKKLVVKLVPIGDVE